MNTNTNTALLSKLWEAIGYHSAQIAETGNQAPGEKLTGAMAAVEAALSAAAQPPAPDDHISMPKYWSVEVNADGEQLLSIGENWLSGQKKLEEQDEKTIIGAARHLLSFVGYGLPASSFDPDEDAAATPKPIKTSSPEIPDNCAAAPKATKAEPVQPTDTQCDAILVLLDELAHEYDRHEFGLPLDCGEAVPEQMRAALRGWVAGIQPAHREQP